VAFTIRSVSRSSKEDVARAVQDRSSHATSFYLRYCSSLTFSSQSTFLPFSVPESRCASSRWSASPPCQYFKPGGTTQHHSCPEPEVRTRRAAKAVANFGFKRGTRTPQRHGPSSIANETAFEPRVLNRELLWSEVLGSFPEGLAPPAGREAAAPAGPGAGERLGCES